MKKSLIVLTTLCMTGFGAFFSNLRQAVHIKEETTTVTQPPTTTEVPYARPVGVHEAPDGHGQMIALTFDDGPGGDVTNHILGTLKDVGARATFFCLGDRAEEYQRTLKRMRAMGCEIASHSWSHERLTRLGGDDLEEDLAKTAWAIEEFSGTAPRYLRPPYGSVSDRMLSHVDMPVILWSIDSEDWRYCEELRKGRSKEQREEDYKRVVNSILDYVQDGDIVLMHDLYAFTQDAADAVIAELHHKGWQMVTVSELFDAKGIVPRAGEVYHSAR